MKLLFFIYYPFDWADFTINFKVPGASSSSRRHHGLLNIYQGFKTISRVFCIIS